jgi:hypothetical protein
MEDYDAQKMADAASVIRENQRGLVLTGRITNGRVELDQSTLDEIGRKFPDAEISFVAVNAPFDPESQLV